MKLLTILSVSAGLALAPMAQAGNLIFEAPVEQQVDEAEPIGGSGRGWIVPVLAIAIVAAAIIANDDDDEPASQEPRGREIPSDLEINLR